MTEAPASSGDRCCCVFSQTAEWSGVSTGEVHETQRISCFFLDSQKFPPHLTFKNWPRWGLKLFFSAPFQLLSFQNVSHELLSTAEPVGCARTVWLATPFIWPKKRKQKNKEWRLIKIYQFIRWTLHCTFVSLVEPHPHRDHLDLHLNHLKPF